VAAGESPETVVPGRGTEMSEGGMLLYAGILLNPGDMLCMGDATFWDVPVSMVKYPVQGIALLGAACIYPNEFYPEVMLRGPPGDRMVQFIRQRHGSR